jgi:chromosomal replication initiator protein
MTMQNLWHACLRRLEQELPAQQFNTWIRPLAPEAGAAGSATLALRPDRFILERVRHLRRAHRGTAAGAGNREVDIKLVLARARTPPLRAPAPARPRRGGFPPERARLNRGFTFAASSPARLTSWRARPPCR